MNKFIHFCVLINGIFLNQILYAQVICDSTELDRLENVFMSLHQERQGNIFLMAVTEERYQDAALAYVEFQNAVIQLQ